MTEFYNKTDLIFFLKDILKYDKLDNENKNIIEKILNFIKSNDEIEDYISNVNEDIALEYFQQSLEKTKLANLFFGKKNKENKSKSILLGAILFNYYIMNKGDECFLLLSEEDQKLIPFFSKYNILKKAISNKFDEADIFLLCLKYKFYLKDSDCENAVDKYKMTLLLYYSILQYFNQDVEELEENVGITLLIDNIRTIYFKKENISSLDKIFFLSSDGLSELIKFTTKKDYFNTKNNIEIASEYDIPDRTFRDLLSGKQVNWDNVARQYHASKDLISEEKIIDFIRIQVMMSLFSVLYKLGYVEKIVKENIFDYISMLAGLAGLGLAGYFEDMHIEALSTEGEGKLNDFYRIRDYYNLIIGKIFKDVFDYLVKGNHTKKFIYKMLAGAIKSVSEYKPELQKKDKKLFGVFLDIILDSDKFIKELANSLYIIIKEKKDEDARKEEFKKCRTKYETDAEFWNDMELQFLGFDCDELEEFDNNVIITEKSFIYIEEIQKKLFKSTEEILSEILWNDEKTKVDIITLMRLQNIKILDDVYQEIFNDISILINQGSKRSNE